jgi:hypothetical protein
VPAHQVEATVSHVFDAFITRTAHPTCGGKRLVQRALSSALRKPSDATDPTRTTGIAWAQDGTSDDSGWLFSALSAKDMSDLDA